MIAGRSDVGAHNPNDMVACIPGDWLVAAKSESECSAPQLEATGYASRTAVSSPSRPLPRRPVLQPPPRDESATVDIDHFDHTFKLTTADDTIERHTFDKSDGTTISRLSGPIRNVRQGTKTNWDLDQRRFAITNNIGVIEHVELDPPLRYAPLMVPRPRPVDAGGSGVGAVNPGLDGHPPSPVPG